MLGDASHPIAHISASDPSEFRILMLASAFSELEM